MSLERLTGPSAGDLPHPSVATTDRDKSRALSAWSSLRTALEVGSGPVQLFDRGERFVRGLLPDARLRQLDEWKQRGCGNLMLVGPTGAGKTTAALAVSMRLHRAFVRPHIEHSKKLGLSVCSCPSAVTWRQATALSLARKQTPLGAGEAETITRSILAPLLVIDDIGWERDSDAIAEVLAARSNAGRTTIMTSGYSLDQIKGRLGPAVVRRMLEVSGVTGKVFRLEVP